MRVILRRGRNLSADPRADDIAAGKITQNLTLVDAVLTRFYRARDGQHGFSSSPAVAIMDDNFTREDAPS